MFVLLLSSFANVAGNAFGRLCQSVSLCVSVLFVLTFKSMDREFEELYFWYAGRSTSSGYLDQARRSSSSGQGQGHISNLEIRSVKRDICTIASILEF